MVKQKNMLRLEHDLGGIQPHSPTAAADIDLVIQEGGQIVVIPVDRCILLPNCFMLADICSTLPADPDHVDCNCFRLRVTLIGVKLDAVRALVDIIYQGNCDLEQVSFEDVKLVADQLGFKGKKGLVKEPRVTKEEEEVVIIEYEENCVGVGEETIVVEDDEVVQSNGQSSREDNIIEKEKLMGGRQGTRESQTEGNRNVRIYFGGNLSQASNGGQANAEVAAGRNGGEENLSDMSWGMLQASTEQQASADIVTSTPVAGSKGWVAQHDDPCSTLFSENDAKKTSWVKAPTEQTDENGNQEDGANPGGRASFSASMGRKDIREGIVEESALGEQDMDLDESLMQKTREPQSGLGCGDQGVRTRRSTSPMMRSASPMMNPLTGNARRSKHNDNMELRRSLNGEVTLEGVQLQQDEINSVIKVDKQHEIKGTMQEKKRTKQRKGLLERSRPFFQIASSSSLRIAIKRSRMEGENVQGCAQSSGAVVKPPKMCRKCDKAIRDQSNLCGNCKAVYHVRCSSGTLQGKGWVCKLCKKNTKREIKKTKEKMKKTQEEIKEIEEARKKVKHKQDGSADGTGKARKATRPGHMRRSQSVYTDMGRNSQLVMKQTRGQKSGVPASTVPDVMHDGSVNVTNKAGKLNVSKGAGLGCEKRKVDGNVAPGGEERARINKRVSFDANVKYVGAQSGGSKRRTACREEGFFSKFWDEHYREEGFRCKNCKTKFPSVGRLRSHNMKHHRRDDDTQTVV